jgi:hypothetical protein
MFGPSFNDYYRAALEKVKQEILQESDAQILGSDIDDLANFYHARHAITPLEFDPAEISFEPKKELRTVSADRREFDYGYEGDIDWEYETVSISIPIQPNRNLDLIKKLNSGSVYMDGFDEDLVYSQSQISYSFDTKWYGGHMDENRVATEIDTKSERLIQTLTEKDKNIKFENNNFLQSIKIAIQERKTKLSADKEKFNSLIQKVKIPLKQKSSTTVTKISVDVKKFIHTIKPAPKRPEEYSLEESILISILDYVDNQCKSFERTPASYKQLGEEQLRDIILSALNGIFEGNATGETFVKKGKTDIHLKIDKGEILIFECKIWGGEKLYLETIDQLIGYVTWRENYGVIVMFCKNKDFSKILTQIPEIIQKHPRYIRGYKKLGDSHFVSEHSLPEDGGKIIKIHHLIYNLYSE